SFRLFSSFVSFFLFFFSSRRRHTRFSRDWSSDVCSSDLFLYFIAYNFILDKEIVYTPIVAISPHIAAFLISFVITFPLGFFLSKYVVFSESDLRGRVQLVRYFSLVLACLLLNYIFIKFFVEYIGIFPTPAKILTTIFVVALSYLSQKHFTFRVKKAVSQAKTD